jgi:hypothetical protein
MASVGTFYFFRDHFVDDEIIEAGTTQEMFSPWTPTPDVEPVDATAALNFYLQGPRLAGVIRTQWRGKELRPPTTYWQNTGGRMWALTGLGAGFGPVEATIGRIE